MIQRFLKFLTKGLGGGVEDLRISGDILQFIKVIK